MSDIPRGIDERAPTTAPAGTTVRATEMCEPEEQDHEPRTMEGVLTEKWIERMGYTQYTVNGVPIDPSTIEVLGGG